MRLWTVHPKYLDSKGLVALWREGLLAQKVLMEETKGYKNHPQLFRFKEQPSPIVSISTYLYWVYKESIRRGYNFDASKIIFNVSNNDKIIATEGQLIYEWKHLLFKLKNRANDCFNELKKIKTPEAHPIFVIEYGKVADWERNN
ncbi:MAG: hypothetical protein HQK76_03170 [Desulfobacterales bacterium]|nr:hypothetical protein [Desulfobacterales bacterium]